VLQRPGQPNLGGGRVACAGNLEQLNWLRIALAVLATSNREERHQRDALLAAGRDQRLGSSVEEAVVVLDADDRRDRLGICEVR
jgi:hypothetical protein